MVKLLNWNKKIKQKVTSDSTVGNQLTHLFLNVYIEQTWCTFSQLTFSQELSYSVIKMFAFNKGSLCCKRYTMNFKIKTVCSFNKPDSTL